MRPFPVAFHSPVLPHSIAYNRPVSISLRTCHVATRMSGKGFGGTPDSPRPLTPSEGQVTREAAAQRLEQMRKQGMPEFSVWVRLIEQKESPDSPDFPWLPVGSISVPRSSDINKAIYDVEPDLMQGVYRLFPKMKGKEEQLEFGWQNKEFTDEEITVAVRPSSLQGTWQKLLSFLPKFGS